MRGVEPKVHPGFRPACILLIIVAGLVVWLIPTPPRRIEWKQTWQIAVAIVGAIAAACILCATFIVPRSCYLTDHGVTIGRLRQADR
ncbi:MAG: hypothetical protein HY318_12485 [Armatimonadetes bacterium]|nr:hypothetical protein [Armatimonadota bacterium]